MKMLRRPSFTAAALICLCGSSGVGVIAASASRAARPPRITAQGASAGSALRLLNLAFADARAAGSFRQQVIQYNGRIRGTLVDDVTLHSGRQVIVSADGTRARILVVGSTAYILGNPHALGAYFKFTRDQVTAIGSDWVSIPSTNTGFAAIAYDVTVPTALAEVAPAGPLQESAVTTVDGQRVIGIRGAVPAVTGGGDKGTETLYVTASSHPLPVRASLQASAAGHASLAMTVTMGHWGEAVDVHPPANSLSTSQVASLAHRLAALTVPNAPAYFTLSGQHGYRLPAGRPWGRACKPIRIAAASSVPGWAYTQIAAVVADARGRGIDVTLESRRFGWNHASLYYVRGQSPATSAEVQIAATDSSPPILSDGRRQDIQLQSRTVPDGRRRNDVLAQVRGMLWLKAVDGRPQLLRSATRQLIAMTQGIGQTNDPRSGLPAAATIDAFSADDTAAMLTMSGCLPTTTSTTTTGVAA